MPFIIVRLPSRHAGSQRENRLGAVQRLYLALLIHAQHHRPIWRIHIQSHDVSNLFDEQRIFGELEVLHPMRLQSKARQMRTIAVCDSPVCSAINRLLQCVLFFGIDSKVAVITSSTSSSVMVRGAPGRGSSNSPSSRFTRKRSRHLQTVAPVIRNFLATAPLLKPSSQPSTMRARIAKAWADFGRRASIASLSFSSGVTFNALVGRPMATPEYAAFRSLFN